MFFQKSLNFWTNLTDFCCWFRNLLRGRTFIGYDLQICSPIYELSQFLCSWHPLDVPKFFILIKSSLFFFLLLVPLMSYVRNHCRMQLSWSFSIMFSVNSFTAVTIKLDLLIHFELIHVPCNFILMHVDIQFSQHHVLKSLFFLFGWYWPSFWKTVWTYLSKFLFFSSLFLFRWSICLPGFQYHTVLITVALQWYLIFKCESSNFVLSSFFNFVLAILCPLRFHMNLGRIFLTPQKFSLDFW